MKKFVYGIVSPEDHIYNFSTDQHRCWVDFFCLFPPPLSEAIRAYELAGYKLQKFKLTQIEEE